VGRCLFQPDAVTAVLAPNPGEGMNRADMRLLPALQHWAENQTDVILVEGQELQVASSVLIDSKKLFWTHLWAGNARALSDERATILDTLPALLCLGDRGAWTWQQPGLDRKFGEFLGGRNQATYPALAWVTPVYVSTGYTSRIL